MHCNINQILLKKKNWLQYITQHFHYTTTCHHTNTMFKEAILFLLFCYTALMLLLLLLFLPFIHSFIQFYLILVSFYFMIWLSYNIYIFHCIKFNFHFIYAINLCHIQLDDTNNKFFFSVYSFFHTPVLRSFRIWKRRRMIFCFYILLFCISCV